MPFWRRIWLLYRLHSLLPKISPFVLTLDKRYGQGSLFWDAWVALVSDALHTQSAASEMWLHSAKVQSVELEHPTTQGRFIDVCVHTAKGVLAIENKPWLWSHDGASKHHNPPIEHRLGRLVQSQRAPQSARSLVANASMLEAASPKGQQTPGIQKYPLLWC